MQSITKKIQRLKDKIISIQETIKRIQDDCRHPIEFRKIEHNDSTGDYEADYYLTEHTCLQCLKYLGMDKS